MTKNQYILETLSKYGEITKKLNRNIDSIYYALKYGRYIGRSKQALIKNAKITSEQADEILALDFRAISLYKNARQYNLQSFDICLANMLSIFFILFFLILGLVFSISSIMAAPNSPWFHYVLSPICLILMFPTFIILKDYFRLYNILNMGKTNLLLNCVKAIPTLFKMVFIKKK